MTVRAPVTLARRKVMRRLTNMGNLSVAVRRAWRALDQAKIAVDTAVDAEARKVLATLSSIEMLNLPRLSISPLPQGVTARCALISCTPQPPSMAARF